MTSYKCYCVYVFKRGILHSKGLVLLSGSQSLLAELFLVSDLVVSELMVLAFASYSINSVYIV